jgi:hypothetical protein
MEIQELSSDISRMQRYGPASTPASVRVETPTVPGSHSVADTAEIRNAYVMTPEVKIPKAEEIKKLIQSNGYPFKSDIYRAISRLTEQDQN